MLDIPSGPLSAALTTLGRQAGIDVLFRDTDVSRRRTTRLRGAMGAREALSRLLAGTGLGLKRTAEGAFIVYGSSEVPAASSSPSEERIPEILVVGRRAQNGDIRRTEDDIQPYQIYARREVERAHSDSIEDFARTRLSANAQISAPAQLTSGVGSTRSEIDLRGLGSNQTLLLVDGRRLPQLPGQVFTFLQSDFNGIPIEMIDRLEVLSGTAGGTYGSGAISGAINVVLRHDYRGAQLTATTGFSTRGDAFQHRLFARYGFSPDHGRTDMSVAISRTRAALLPAGKRNYLSAARARRFANDPAGFIAEHPVGNAINIYATKPLTLDPAFGGQALGSNYTTLPVAAGQDVSVRNQLLIANAGTIDIDLPRGSTGGAASIMAAPYARSIFSTVRHDFGGVEGFVDLIGTRNAGHIENAAQAMALSPLAADRPNNPFQQPIVLAIPTDALGTTHGDVVNVTLRYTAGFIIPISGGWRSNLEYSGGHARTRTAYGGYIASREFSNLFYSGTQQNGITVLDPLTDFAHFESQVKGYRTEIALVDDQSNKFDNIDLRLGGPIAAFPGGPLALTFVAEQRRERVAPSQLLLIFDGTPRPITQLPAYAQRVRSLYGEARLPLSNMRGLLGKVDLQLAIRQEWARMSVPGPVLLTEADPLLLNKHRATTLYTFGARFSPFEGMTLRSSTATGSLPPSTAQLGSVRGGQSIRASDPKRGGRRLGSEAPVTSITGGSPRLKPELAASLSAGVVLTPYGSRGPRFSLDFTRTRKRDEIVPFPDDSAAALVADEARFPDRVTRNPLTDADRALGFTGGPITRLDQTDVNLGATEIDSIDLAYDQDVRLGALGGIALYLRATWEPKYRQRLNGNSPWIERVGYSDGPLEWRGNGGVEWTRGRVTLGGSGQFYGRYRATNAMRDTGSNSLIVRQQGSSYIPSQFYFDLSGAYRFESGRLSENGPELRWALINAFDHRPPTVAAAAGQGYSYYGDPRRRRIQITLDIPLGMAAGGPADN